MSKQYALLRKDGSVYATGHRKDLERALWCVEGGTIIEGEFEHNWNGQIVKQGEATKAPVDTKKKKSDSPPTLEDLADTVKQLRDTVVQQQKQISELTTAVNALKSKKRTKVLLQ